MNQLNLNHGSLNVCYLNRIIETIHKSLCEYPRTMAIRIDLRLPFMPDPNSNMDCDSPVHFLNVDRGVITRFFASLQAQIKHDLACKANEGKRVHQCSVRYAWVMEYSNKHKWHYHVLLLLNKDTYVHLGNYQDIFFRRNLISKIRKAWSSALNGDDEDCMGLVHVPEKPLYYLDINSTTFNLEFNDLIYRCSYMAKDKTKQYCSDYRSFGCSQK